MKMKSECEVTQSCLTLSSPTDCSPPGSSVHGIFQARVLEWGATAFSVPSLNHLLNEIYDPPTPTTPNQKESPSSTSYPRPAADRLS